MGPESGLEYWSVRWQSGAIQQYCTSVLRVAVFVCNGRIVNIEIVVINFLRML